MYGADQVRNQIHVYALDGLAFSQFQEFSTRRWGFFDLFRQHQLVILCYEAHVVGAFHYAIKALGLQRQYEVQAIFNVLYVGLDPGVLCH